MPGEIFLLNFMRVALLVLLGIVGAALLLLGAVLCASARVRLRWGEEGGAIEVGVLFVKIRLYPPKKRRKNPKKSTKREEPRQKGKNSPEKEPGPRRQIDIPALARFAREILREVPFRKTEIDLRRFILTIGTGDAAKTALRYSFAMQAVTALFALFDEGKFTIHGQDAVSVTPDFVGGKSTLALDIALRLPIGATLLSVGRAVLRQARAGTLPFPLARAQEG